MANTAPTSTESCMRRSLSRSSTDVDMNQAVLGTVVESVIALSMASCTGRCMLSMSADSQLRAWSTRIV